MLLADIVLSFYLGASQTRPSDLHVVQQSRDNDATIHSVTWHGYSFRFEIYYGIRLTYIPPYHPWTRLTLDYTHFKVYAETDSAAVQDGIWHGQAFHEDVPMRERVQSIEITHGLNVLALNAIQQLSGPGGTGAYIGAGPVMFVPHAESRVDGQALTTGYEYGGSGFQILAGARGCAGAHPIFAEVKHTRGDPVVRIAEGKAQTVLDTIHELVGIDFHRCR